MTDLYDNSEPFYKNTDDLLDFIGDETDVNTFIVAKHVVTPAGTKWGELYKKGETTLDPVRIVRLDDLPKILEAFMKVSAEAMKAWRDDRRKAIKEKLDTSIHQGIEAEADWDGPSIKPGTLTDDQINWLAAWLEGDGVL